MQIKYAIVVLSILSTGIFAVPVKRDSSSITSPPSLAAESSRQLEGLLAGLVGNIISQVAPSVVSAIQNSITGFISSIFSRDDIANILLSNSAFKSYLVDVPKVGPVVLVGKKPNEYTDVDPIKYEKKVEDKYPTATPHPVKKPQYSTHATPTFHSSYFDSYESQSAYIEEMTQYLQIQKDKIVEQLNTLHKLMNEPDYTKPYYEKPHYGNENFEKPNYEKPYFEVPNYGSLNYEKPNNGKPNYQKPYYVVPNYNTQNYEKPNHVKPNYVEANYEKPNIERPNTEKPNIEKPNTEKPNTEKPNIEKPNTEKPIIEKPNTEKPNYEYPQYFKPANHEVSHYAKPHYGDSHYAKPHYVDYNYVKPQYQQTQYPKPYYVEHHTTMKPFTNNHPKPTYVMTQSPHQHVEKPGNKNDAKIDVRSESPQPPIDDVRSESAIVPDEKLVHAKETVAE